MIAERRFGILECTGGIHVSGEGERPICKRDDASSDPRDYLGQEKEALRRKEMGEAMVLQGVLGVQACR